MSKTQIVVVIKPGWPKVIEKVKVFHTDLIYMLRGETIEQGIKVGHQFYLFPHIKNSPQEGEEVEVMI